MKLSGFLSTGVAGGLPTQGEGAGWELKGDSGPTWLLQLWTEPGVFQVAGGALVGPKAPVVAVASSFCPV